MVIDTAPNTRPRLSWLDGMRALAALWVMLGHALTMEMGPATPAG